MPDRFSTKFSSITRDESLPGEKYFIRLSNCGALRAFV